MVDRRAHRELARGGAAGVATLALTLGLACDRARIDADARRAPAATGAPSDEPPLLAPRPPYRDPSTLAGLASLPLTELRAEESKGVFRAKLGARDVLVVAGTLELPQQWRPQVALYRLARRLELPQVPETIASRISLQALVGASDDVARRRIRDEIAVLPDGRVPLAITLLPERPTTTRGSKYSLEASAWARAAEADAPPPADASLATEGYVAHVALDYLTGNLFRRSVAQEADGRLWLLDNRGAFTEHPDPRAVDIELDKLKRAQRHPAALLRTLATLDERTLDEDLRAGSYEEWLVHRRPIAEVLQRARALRGLVMARSAERGERAFDFGPRPPP